MPTQNSNLNSQNKIGALWSKTSKNGMKFLTGNLEIGGKKQPIVIFPNKYKKDGQNDPDFVMFKSQPLNNQNGGQRKAAPKKQQNEVVEEPSVDLDDDDILLG